MKVKDLKGKFHAIATINSEWVFENREEIKNNIMQQLQNQGAEPYEDNGNIYIKMSNQFFMLPKLERVRTGIVIFKSNSFDFHYVDSTGETHASYCDKPKAANMLENGFTTLNMRGDITHWQLSKIED